MSPHNNNTHKATTKYLWKRLKAELKKCITRHNISNPVSLEDLTNILLDLGYIKHNGKKVKINGKEIQLEKQVMKIIKIHEAIAKEVYHIDQGTVTTLEFIRAMVFYLCCPNEQYKSKLVYKYNSIGKES